MCTTVLITSLIMLVLVLYLLLYDVLCSCATATEEMSKSWVGHASRCNCCPGAHSSCSLSASHQFFTSQVFCISCFCCATILRGCIMGLPTCPPFCFIWALILKMKKCRKIKKICECSHYQKYIHSASFQSKGKISHLLHVKNLTRWRISLINV